MATSSKRARQRPAKKKRPKKSALTQQHKIELALKILVAETDVEGREDCTAYIIGSLLEWTQLPHLLKPKERTKVVGRLLSDLRSLEISSRPLMPPFFPANEAVEGFDDLLKLASIIERLKKRCGEVLALDAGKPRRNSDKQRWAADAAVSLMYRYRASSFDNHDAANLASILYGDREADLTRYLPKASRKKPGTK